MPFFFNLKTLIGVIFTLAILFTIIFFFAFFAIIVLPLLLVLYLFRKKILFYFIKKKFSNKFYGTTNKGDFYNIYENNNKDYIEVDYEKNKEEDNKN
mgnify:FL=1